VAALQNEIKQSSLNEKRVIEEEPQAVQKQTRTIQSEVPKPGSNARKYPPTYPANNDIVMPKSLEDRLDKLQRELANNATVIMSRLNGVDTVEEERESGETCERFDRGMNKLINVRSINPPKKLNAKAHTSRGVSSHWHQPSSHETIDVEDWGVESIDTYVSTRSINGSIIEDDQARDDVEAFDANFSYQGNMEALGMLTEEQRIALERLDLSGDREELTKMLGTVPGLTRKQVDLLVDVATSLSA
jgi:hypothetical protein